MRWSFITLHHLNNSLFGYVLQSLAVPCLIRVHCRQIFVDFPEYSPNSTEYVDTTKKRDCGKCFTHDTYEMGGRDRGNRDRLRSFAASIKSMVRLGLAKRGQHGDRKSTRLNSSHGGISRMPSSA